MHVVNDNNCGWINDLNPRTNIKSLSTNEDCDWLIIGAGYTGPQKKPGALAPGFLSGVRTGLRIQANVYFTGIKPVSLRSNEFLCTDVIPSHEGCRWSEFSQSSRTWLSVM